MHYTGTIWRPPYEAGSLLLQVTAGCTHHRCKFCTLYHELPFSFRMSPLEEVEADLVEAQMLWASPTARLSARLQDLPAPEIRRVYLTGGNPFALSADKLAAIARLIRRYLPGCQSIGCFARVTDITPKSGGELAELRALGYDGLTIGVESGDGEALAFMDKGYAPEDIVRQCARLDGAGIGYHFFYLTGLSGAGNGARAARESALIFNQTRPQILGASMLTLYPESRLYEEVRAGRWAEAGEHEKLEELARLIAGLEIPVWFAALGASNAVPLQGTLPEEREAVLEQVQAALRRYSEADLRRYRTHLPHL